MNKTQIAAVSCLGILAGVSFIQMREDRKNLAEGPIPAAAPAAQPPVESRPIPVEEVVANYMTGLGAENTEVSRLVTLAGVLDELESPVYKGVRLATTLGEALTQAALKAVEEAGKTGSPETAALKRRLSVFIVSRARGETAQAFAMKTLGEGPEEIRSAILPHLGSPDGVGGKAVFAKIQEFQAGIPGELYPRVIRRVGGKKALPVLVSVMQSTADWKVVAACAVALQDLKDPSVMGPILERLEQVGLLDKQARLPFISGELLAAHLEEADGSALQRGVKIVQTRPSLSKWTVKTLEKGLESSDAQTRLSSASAIRRGVVGGHMKAEEGERLLSGRMERETEPVLKAEITGGLEQLRGRPETKQ